MNILVFYPGLYCESLHKLSLVYVHTYVHTCGDDTHLVFISRLEGSSVPFFPLDKLICEESQKLYLLLC